MNKLTFNEFIDALRPLISGFHLFHTILNGIDQIRFCANSK